MSDFARSTAGPSAIPVHSIGQGPGLVVLHGAAVAGSDYRRLAQALADRCTVHLYDRRGRPGTEPQDERYGIAPELYDLAAVLAHTGAEHVFGHSGGGFVALRAGLELPVTRIAAYDPGLSVSGRPSYAFLDAFTAAIAAGDHAGALTEMTRGVYPDSAPAKLPRGLQRFASRQFLRTAVGRRMAALLPTVPAEVREIVAHDGPPTDYAAIRAEVLLVAGARSPRYFAENCAAVAGAIPRGRSAVLPRADHNAPNIAGPEIVRLLGDFFADATVSSNPTFAEPTADQD